MSERSHTRVLLAILIPFPFCLRLIKRTGRYALLSIVGLAMPIISIYVASFWSESTSEFSYTAEIFPAGLGYSIFLCCSLGMCLTSFLLPNRLLTLPTLPSRTYCRSRQGDDAKGDFSFVYGSIPRQYCWYSRQCLDTARLVGSRASWCASI